MNILSIEEGTVKIHVEEVISDQWSLTKLGIVESDTSKEWDLLLVSIKLQIIFDGSLDHCLDGGLCLVKNLWDNGALDEWDEDVGNLADKGSTQGDIDIIGVKLDINTVNLETWG